MGANGKIYRNLNIQKCIENQPQEAAYMDIWMLQDNLNTV